MRIWETQIRVGVYHVIALTDTTLFILDTEERSERIDAVSRLQANIDPKQVFVGIWACTIPLGTITSIAHTGLALDIYHTADGGFGSPKTICLDNLESESFLAAMQASLGPQFEQRIEQLGVMQSIGSPILTAIFSVMIASVFLDPMPAIVVGAMCVTLCFFWLVRRVFVRQTGTRLVRKAQG